MTGMCIDNGGPNGGCANCPILDTCWVIRPWMKRQAIADLTWLAFRNLMGAV